MITVFLALLLGLIVLVAELANRVVDHVHLFNHYFPVAVLIIPFIFPIRDVVQEKGKRGIALLSMLIAGVVYYFFGTAQSATIAAGALIWAELVDFVLYTHLRRFGILFAMLFSDIISVPLILAMYLVIFDKSLSILKYLPAYIVFAQIVVVMGIYSLMLILSPIRKFVLSGSRKGMEV